MSDVADQNDATKPNDVTKPSDVTERYLDVRGVRTCVRSAGDGPPLLYLHGAGGCGRWFEHHAALAERFTVYAPDHPGWGSSENVEWMDAFEDYVLHYDDLLRQLAIERPVLVGHSLGGWMAAHLAITYPDRFAGLVLICAAGLPIAEGETLPDFFGSAARGGPEFARLIFHDREAALRFFPAQPTPQQTLQTFREMTSAARLAWKRWFDDKLPRRLARVTAPALVLWGAHERLFPLSHGERYAAALPNARLQVLPDCGHMLPYERPAALAEAVGVWGL